MDKRKMTFKVQLVDDETGEVIQQEITKDVKVAFSRLSQMEKYYKENALENEIPF